MLGRLLIAGQLVGYAVTVQAAETEYAFQWTGFAEMNASGEIHAWHPAMTYGGTFRGEDIDSDSVIRLDEISSLRMTSSPDFVVGCPAAGIGVAGASDCHLSNFTYHVGGELAFSASYQISDNGDPLHHFSFSPPYGMTWEPTHLGDGYEYRITENTTFQITAVPEPATCAMMLGGLGVLGFAARRRKA